MSDTLLRLVVASLVFLYGACKIVEYSGDSVVHTTPKHEFNPDPVNPMVGGGMKCNAIFIKPDGTYVLVYQKRCHII